MKNCTYVGPSEELRGKTGLLKEEINLGGTRCCKVQFDDQDLVLGGVPLAYGWHLFPIAFFQFDEETPDMRYPNDISRPLDGADNLNISISVPGSNGVHTWRAGRTKVAASALETVDAALRYLIDLDLDRPITSALLVPDTDPGRTVMAVIRHEDEEPRSVRFLLCDNHLTAQ